MTFDTTAYYGQPTAMLPPITPPGLFGGFPGPYGFLAEQALAAHLGQSPFGGAFGGPRAHPLRPSPFDMGLLSLMPMPTAPIPWAAGFPGQYGQTLGGWAGQPQLCGIGAQALPGISHGYFGALAGAALPGAIGGWFAPALGNPFQGNPFQALGNPFQAFGHQFGGGLNRFQPYQAAVPQASYGG